MLGHLIRFLRSMGGDLQQWMFQAAQAGCLICVRHYLLQKKIHLNSVSEEGWSVIEYAMRGVREGKEGAASGFATCVSLER